MRGTGYLLPRRMLRVQRPGRRSSVSREEAIRAVIAEIPRGRVATYGQVAEAAGFPRGARLAARALRGSDGLPWQRVVAAGGRIALSGVEGQDQRIRLRAEGVTFRGSRVRMDLHTWRGPLGSDGRRAPSGARTRSKSSEPGAMGEGRAAIRIAFERELGRLPGLQRRSSNAAEPRRVYVRGGREVVRVGPGTTIALRRSEDGDGGPFPDRRGALPPAGRPPRGRWRTLRLATTDDLIAGLALVEAALLEPPAERDRRVGGLDPGRTPRGRRAAPRSARVNRR